MTVKEKLIAEIENTPDSHLIQQVLDFFHFLKLENQEVEIIEETYQPQTELGKKLWSIRQNAIARGEVKQLLNWDEINQEVAARRGDNHD